MLSKQFVVHLHLLFYFRYTGLLAEYDVFWPRVSLLGYDLDLECEALYAPTVVLTL
jgi:hypothetical protein